MIDVCVLGTGKVGTHFINECISNPKLNLIQVYNKSSKGVALYKDMVATTQNLLELKKVNIYIVALPDEVLPTLNLQHLKGLVVHTSGTVPYQQLKAKNRGVFYPLQSFSKEKKINFKNTPLCIEIEFNDSKEIIHQLATSISNQVHFLDKKKREKLHLAAVFANNFSNRVIGIAYDICKENQIDSTILQPLLHETFLKTQILNPSLAQTGPALRNDTETLQKHLEQLKGINKNIYTVLTQSIQERHDIEL